MINYGLMCRYPLSEGYTGICNKYLVFTIPVIWLVTIFKKLREDEKEFGIKKEPNKKTQQLAVYYVYSAFYYYLMNFFKKKVFQIRLSKKIVQNISPDYFLIILLLFLVPVMKEQGHQALLKVYLLSLNFLHCILTSLKGEEQANKTQIHKWSKFPLASYLLRCESVFLPRL